MREIPPNADPMLAEEYRQFEACRVAVDAFVEEGARDFPWIWRIGDDKAGYILGMIEDAARMRGLTIS